MKFRLCVLASPLFLAMSCLHNSQKKLEQEQSVVSSTSPMPSPVQKICVFGKGGAGKSTVSWLLSKALAEDGYKVLAIDADYNLDLVEAFGVDVVDFPKINESAKDFYAYQGLKVGQLYRDLISRERPNSFHLSPLDNFTQKYSQNVEPNIQLMTAGGHNKNQLFGSKCSHGYIVPLKYYMAALELKPNEFMVADSVAGTDMVTYGLCLGADALVTVVGNAETSVKVFRQIEEIAGRLQIPSYAIFNRVGAKQIERLSQTKPLAHFVNDEALSMRDFSKLSEANRQEVKTLIHNLRSITIDKSASWKRFKRWDELNKAQPEEEI